MTDKNKFKSMLDNLNLQEITAILNDLIEYNADKVFITCCQEEINDRRKMKIY